MSSKKKSWPQQQPERAKETNEEAENGPSEGNEEENKKHSTWLSALLLGSAMVARGEIGLLIIEIGYNSTTYVSEEGFITGVWAILLNTIIGPVTVGVLVKFFGRHIGEGKWGLQEPVAPARRQ